jgi:hypothetical protein
MGIQNTSAIPASVVNAGNGIMWANPGNATGTGAGSAVGTVVVSFSITSNVVTFVTNPQAFIAGQTVVISGMFTGTYLNAITLIVLASGLSSTGFTANFTHADVASAFDSGFITPTTTYTTATNFPYVSLSPGQHALYITGQDGPMGQANNGPHHIGAVTFLASSIAATMRGTGGVNGYPIGPPTAGSASLPFATPTLPAGSTVVAIRPYATGLVTATGGGASLAVTATWSGGSANVALTGSPTILGSIGTSLSLVSTLQFQNSGESTLETQTGYNYSNSVSDYGVVIIYTTTGTPIPDTQLQTLVATNLSLSMVPNAIITGVQVAFNAGSTAGSGTDPLTAQLTLNGTPIGNTKTVSSLSAWSTPYALGGSTDPWGNVLSGAQVSGSSGLGVNINGTLSSGDQINLNSLTITIYYLVPPVVVHISVGNTRSLTVGFN